MAENALPAIVRVGYELFHRLNAWDYFIKATFANSLFLISPAANHEEAPE